jgi:hypothetical protein
MSLFYVLYLLGAVIAAIGALQAVYGGFYYVNPSFEQIIDIRSNLFLHGISELLKYNVKPYFFMEIGLREEALFAAVLITIISVCSIPIAFLKRRWVLFRS